MWLHVFLSTLEKNTVKKGQSQAGSSHTIRAVVVCRGIKLEVGGGGL